MKNKWRLSLAGASCLLALSACGGSDNSAGAGETQGTESSLRGTELVAATWGGVVDQVDREALLEPFAKPLGITVKTEEAPGEIVAKLKAQATSGNVTWSLMDTTEEDTIALGADGLVQPLPDDLRAKLVQALGERNVSEYGVRTGFSASVFVCNTEMVEKCPTNPEEFFDTNGFPGPRGMNGVDPARMLILALAADGVSEADLTSGAPIDIDRAIAKLEEIKPSVAVWWTSGDQSQQIFRDKEVAMGVMWSGRAAGLLEQDVPVQISFDRAIVDNYVWGGVPTDAPNAEAAFQFLEWFATHPEAQAAYANGTAYGVPSAAAYESVKPEIARYDPNAPENRDKTIVPDLTWAVENMAEIQKRWNAFLSS